MGPQARGKFSWGAVWLAPQCLRGVAVSRWATAKPEVVRTTTGVPVPGAMSPERSGTPAPRHRPTGTGPQRFYGIVKDSAEHGRFVFVTGVSLVSKVRLFSGLHNLGKVVAPDAGAAAGAGPPLVQRRTRAGRGKRIQRVGGWEERNLDAVNKNPPGGAKPPGGFVPGGQGLGPYWLPGGLSFLSTPNAPTIFPVPTSEWVYSV